MSGAALFDWDGTLIDSRDALIGAWHVATDAILGRRFPATPEHVELVMTQPGIRLFARVAGDAERAARLARAFQDAYADTGKRARPFPGVVELLTRVRDGGVPIAVVTSKGRERFETDADRAGVRGLVDVAVCQEDTDRYKPDPAPVLLALRELGVAPERAVFVGDTPVDVAAATAAGTAAIGVAWGAAGAAALLEAGADEVATDAEHLARIVLGRDGMRDHGSQAAAAGRRRNT